MPLKRSVLVIGILSILLSLTSAKAQTAVTYRFLQVVDLAGKPVVDARVETNMSTNQTDEHGAVKQIPVYYGDFTTRSLKVSKPGYFPYESTDILHPTGRDDHLLTSEGTQYNPRERIKIELLKMPVTAAEHKAFEVREGQRELLQAAQQGDATTLRRLLQAEVDANAADVNGIPAVLWAASSGNAEVLKALLEAGADVRSRNKPDERHCSITFLHTHDFER